MPRSRTVARRAFAMGALLSGALACAAPEPATLRVARALDVQGHRGARGLLPENTLPAFDLALDLGVTTLELDLGMTKDGVVVVAHDPYVPPKLCLGPDGSPIPGEKGPLLRDLTLEEVQAYDCGSLNPDVERFPEPPREKRPGTPMPTLAQVFERVAERKSRVRFNIEVKATPGDPATRPLPEFVQQVVLEVERAGVVDRTTIQSFQWEALELAKALEPRLRTAGLVEPRNLTPAWLGGLDPADFPDFLALLREARYVDELSPWWRQLDESGDYALGVDILALQRAGYRVVPWTVNDRPTMRALMERGVDGIITDYPDRLIEVVLEAGYTVKRPGAAASTPPGAAASTPPGAAAGAPPGAAAGALPNSDR